MKSFKSLLGVALATVLSVSVFANGGVAPSPLKVDTKASTFKWLGKKFTGEHNGTVDIQSGNLVLNGSKLVGGEFVIDMKSIKDLDVTNPEYNGKLVKHLSSPDFFDVEHYPTANLKITKAVAKNAASYDVTGELTINGVKQTINFPVALSIVKGLATATAKFEVDRTKFGSKYGSKTFFESIGDKVIYDNFEVDVKIVASK